MLGVLSYIVTFAKIINIFRFRKIKYNMAFLFIIYYTFDGSRREDLEAVGF